MNDDFPVIFTENLTKSYEKDPSKLWMELILL